MRAVILVLHCVPAACQDDVNLDIGACLCIALVFAYIMWLHVVDYCSSPPTPREPVDRPGEALDGRGGGPLQPLEGGSDGLVVVRASGELSVEHEDLLVLHTQGRAC
jgi:hypothetical protein